MEHKTFQNYNEDIINCSLKIEPLIAYNLYPLYCKVRLNPLDPKFKDVYCKIEVPKIEFIQIHDSSSEIDNKVNLELSKNKFDIDNTVHLDVSPIQIEEIDIENRCNLIISDYKNIDISSFLSVPDKFESDEVEIINSVKIDNEKFESKNAQISNRVFLQYDRSNTYIDNILMVGNRRAKSDIKCRVAYNSENESKEINCKVNLFKFVQDLSWNNTIKVPGYRGIYTFPCEINVQNGKNYYLNSTITVINDTIYDIDCNTNMEYDKSENDIDFTLNLVPIIREDIENSLFIKQFNTRREIDCIVNNIGNTIFEFGSIINVEEPAIEPSELNKEFNCDLITGFNDIIDIESTMEVVVPVNLDYDIDFTLKVLPKARIGILVDPLWNYDPFVLKSSLLTLFDKYFEKMSLTIFYGGNKRSDWDIEHLGYIYKYNLVKIPLLLNKMKLKESIDSLDHFMYHLFEEKVDKIFIFVDNHMLIKSSIFRPLVDICINNKIPLTLISSSGEYTNFNEYDYNEENIQNKDNIIIKNNYQNIFHKINKPNSPEHPYNHPDKIVY